MFGDCYPTQSIHLYKTKGRKAQPHKLAYGFVSFSEMNLCKTPCLDLEVSFGYALACDTAASYGRCSDVCTIQRRGRLAMIWAVSDGARICILSWLIAPLCAFT